MAAHGGVASSVWGWEAKGEASRLDNAGNGVFVGIFGRANEFLAAPEGATMAAMGAEAALEELMDESDPAV